MSIYDRSDDTLSFLDAGALDQAEVRQPIFVPSRGRAGLSQTIKHLEAAELDYYAVVEPQDYDVYVDTYGVDRIIQMDENDRGIAYVRNAILDLATEMGAEWCWQLDDNLVTIVRRSKEGTTKLSARAALAYLERTITPYWNVGAGGLRSAVFAYTWLDKPSVQVNAMMYSAELLRLETGVRFKEGTVEDIDFSIRLLYEGWCSVLSNRVVFTKPSGKRMPGGNTEIEYGPGGRGRRTKGLMEDWPGTFTLKEKEGVPYCVPKPGTWTQFTQEPEEEVTT